MKILNLFLNYSCNARCGFCFNPASPSEGEWRGMSTPRALSVLLEARRDGYEAVSFIGGEATVRRDFIKIVAAARRVGFRDRRLVTNGLKLADPAAADALAKAGLTSVEVSLHSHLPEVHDRLLGVPGALQKALAAVENLRRHPVSLGANVVVNRLNYRQLPETAEELLRRGVRRFSFFSLRYIGHMGLTGNIEELKVSMTETAPFVRRALESLERAGCLGTACLGDFVPCVLPGYEALLTDWERGCNPDRLTHPDGRVEDSDPVCSDGKRQVPGCAGCAFQRRCFGVHEAYLQVFGEGEFKALAEEPAPKLVRAERILS